MKIERLELGIIGRGKTKEEAMKDSEANSLKLLEERNLDYDLILYGPKNIIISHGPLIEIIRDVTFEKRTNRYRLKIG